MTRRWSQDCSLIGDALTLFQVYCSELLIIRTDMDTHKHCVLHVKDLVIFTLNFFHFHIVVVSFTLAWLGMKFLYIFRTPWNNLSFKCSLLVLGTTRTVCFIFHIQLALFFLSLHLLLVSSSKYISIFTCSRHMPNSFNWCLDFLLYILHRNSCSNSL